ncbi:MAG: hypothetical protein AAF196_15000 [Planctomycetota bacterium]
MRPVPNRLSGSLLRLGVLTVALAPAAMAQEEQDPNERVVQIRVLDSRAQGQATIDRGSNDQVQIGDRIALRPRDGRLFRGTVRSVDARTAVVDLELATVSPVPGTRGEIRLPASRFGPSSEEGDQPAESPSQPGTIPNEGELQGPTLPENRGPVREEPRLPDHPGWGDRDSDYQQGEPLLAGGVRPAERPTTWRGRVWFAADGTKTPETDYAESFLRGGLAADVDNPFGYGGVFESALEVNYRTEFDDEESTNLNVRRLSYTIGGDRFDANRVQVGRFLQHGMPDFGFVDGVEFTHRFDHHWTFGASTGFQPVEDDNFNTFDDFQVSAYALWSDDEFQDLTFGVGFQKSWHEGTQDRDVLALKTHWRASENWIVDARALVDVHGSNDNIRNETFLVSQAVASATRFYDDGSQLQFGYRRLAFPQLRRREFLPVAPTELFDDRADRLFIDGKLQASDSTQWHAFAAAYTDEESNGGSGELGVLFGAPGESSIDLTVFGNGSEHAGVFGGRFLYQLPIEDGTFSTFYELANIHETGFVGENNDFLQHRLRVSASQSFASGWDLELYTEGLVYAEDIAWSVGFFFQRRL